MKQIVFVVTILSLSVFFGSPLWAVQRLALVVGNSSYKTVPLSNPVNDATDMAAVLKRLGFTVTMELNATHRKMERAVRRFGKQLRNGGVGLFYFARFSFFTVPPP